jgi:hypothetical protein
MARRVEIAAGYRGVGLPGNFVLSAGESVVLSDANWDRISGSSLVGTAITDLGATTDAPDPTPDPHDDESTPGTGTSVALNYHYTADNAPLPVGAGDGIALTGVAGAPVETPSQGDWDTAAGVGTTAPCALLPAGVWAVAFRWGASGADLAGAYAYAGVMDAQAVPTLSADPTTSGVLKQVTWVLDVPSRIYCAAGADNDDESRFFDVDLWATKIADLA